MADKNVIEGVRQQLLEAQALAVGVLGAGASEDAVLAVFHAMRADADDARGRGAVH